MKKFKEIIIVIILIGTALDMQASPALDLLFKDTDAFLNRWVSNGKVDYQGVKQNFSSIEGLYKRIGQMDLAGVEEIEKKAFYINAYNLIVIYQVSKYFPLKSPMDQSGFFDKVDHMVTGKSMSLNDLEIGKLIIPYQDARVHFALACAAVSCPKLANFAYTPSQLDQQLDKRADLAINDNTFIRVDTKAKKVLVSKIFNWYEKDFTRDGQSIWGFINQYRKQPLPSNFALGYYEYDWQLNAQQ